MKIFFAPLLLICFLFCSLNINSQENGANEITNPAIKKLLDLPERPLVEIKCLTQQMSTIGKISFSSIKLLRSILLDIPRIHFKGLFKKLYPHYARDLHEIDKRSSHIGAAYSYVFNRAREVRPEMQSIPLNKISSMFCSMEMGE